MSFLLSKLGNWLASSNTQKRKEDCIALYKTAMDARKNRNYQVACKIWKEISEKYPKIHSVWNSWGVDLGELGDLGGPDAQDHYHEACEKFQKAIEFDPDDEKAFYNWGNTFLDMAKFRDLQVEEYYCQACEKYQKSTDIKPDNYEALCNWGFALCRWGDLGGPKAEELYQNACEKFHIAAQINPDELNIFSSWGLSLIHLAKLKEEKELLYQEAEKVLLKAEEIKKGAGAYNLACIFALRGDKNKCQEWLKIGEEAGTLAPREHAMKDDDLALVRDKDWFKAIRWKDE